jgi:AcrR family transcriptional regulator
MSVIFKKIKKRKAGERAGMTRAKIAKAAIKLWDEAGPDGFTIRKLAVRLKVVPTTIRAHFKDGAIGLRREIARRVLEDWTPPYKPSQTPKDYLTDFFRCSLAFAGQRPRLARLVVLELTDDPLLSLVFAERICATIAHLAANVNLIWALELLIGQVTEPTLLESGVWGRQNSQANGGAIQARLMGASKTEYPTLTMAPQKLAAGVVQRKASGYIQARAEEIVASFVQNLAKGGPKSPSDV